MWSVFRADGLLSDMANLSPCQGRTRRAEVQADNPHNKVTTIVLTVHAGSCLDRITKECENKARFL